jgi:hypothetical protein
MRAVQQNANDERERSSRKSDEPVNVLAKWPAKRILMAICLRNYVEESELSGFDVERASSRRVATLRRARLVGQSA